MQLEYRSQETLATAARIAKVLNEAQIEYAILKTIRPYPATPNDTDIICLEPNDKYKDALVLLMKSGYSKLGETAMQVLLSDPRGAGIAKGDKSGGIYYIDFYKQLAVDYIIYVSKKKLSKHLISIEVAGYNKVKVLRPEAELAVILMHSVFPEMTYALENFFTTLHYFRDWEEMNFEWFVKFIKNNYITLPLRANLSVTAFLHMEAFGNIPEKLLHILDRLGGIYWSEIKRIKKKQFSLPFKFSFTTFLKSFSCKLVELSTFNSLIVQFLHMLNPFFTLDVLKSLHNRLKKETYKHM